MSSTGPGVPDAREGPPVLPRDDGAGRDCASLTSGASDWAGGVVAVPAGAHSRLLYANPVCLLGSTSSAGDVNVMTISWLTPTTNHVRVT